MIQYKGKGEHSVQGLEHIIEYQIEELHQLKTRNVKCLDRLREQYKETFTGSMDDKLLRKRKYFSLRTFCLDCELVSFNDIEVMEDEVNNEVNRSF